MESLQFPQGVRQQANSDLDDFLANAAFGRFASTLEIKEFPEQDLDLARLWTSMIFPPLADIVRTTKSPGLDTEFDIPQGMAEQMRPWMRDWRFDGRTLPHAMSIGDPRNFRGIDVARMVTRAAMGQFQRDDGRRIPIFDSVFDVDAPTAIVWNGRSLSDAERFDTIAAALQSSSAQPVRSVIDQADLEDILRRLKQLEEALPAGRGHNNPPLGEEITDEAVPAIVRQAAAIIREELRQPEISVEPVARAARTLEKVFNWIKAKLDGASTTFTNTLAASTAVGVAAAYLPALKEALGNVLDSIANWISKIPALTGLI